MTAGSGRRPTSPTGFPEGVRLSRLSSLAERSGALPVDNDGGHVVEVPEVFCIVEERQEGAFVTREDAECAEKT